MSVVKLKKFKTKTTIQIEELNNNRLIRCERQNCIEMERNSMEKGEPPCSQIHSHLDLFSKSRAFIQLNKRKKQLIILFNKA